VRAIQKCNISAHPHVIFYRDSLALHSLVFNGNVHLVKAVIFRMKAHMLAH